MNHNGCKNIRKEAIPVNTEENPATMIGHPLHLVDPSEQLFPMRMYSGHLHYCCGKTTLESNLMRKGIILVTV